MPKRLFRLAFVKSDLVQECFEGSGDSDSLAGRGDKRNRDRRFEAIVKALPDNILIFDREGTIIDCSLAPGFPAELSAEEIRGQRLGEPMPGDLVATTLRHFEDVITTRKEVVFRGGGGRSDEPAARLLA